MYLGDLPLADPHAEDALQAHCRPPQENRACLPPALSPVVPRQPPPQAHLLCLVLGLVQLHRYIPGLYDVNGPRRVLALLAPQLADEL
jgi:hypothetical protein